MAFLAGLIAVVGRGCSQIPMTTVQPESDPAVTVECRTEPNASQGDCAGWAALVLAELSDEVPRSARLILAGPMGPFHPAACTAEFLGLVGESVSKFQVDCFVPSGG